MKVFKLREGGAPAAERLKSEISVLQQNRPNLPRLLDSNIEERWMVTEYFPSKTLSDSPEKYKGQPFSALQAFRRLVETIALLHKDGIVHRDIKPANIFIRSDGRLIPGDFGIVHLPGEWQRMTILGERVGPWEYMPPWADGLGDQLEKVQTNFDVYMLGKLLWCMVAGRLKLRREFFDDSEYDLTKAFPMNEQMHRINSILAHCLVDRPEKCLASAQELLSLVDQNLVMMERNVPVVDNKGQLILPCRVCGIGTYSDITMGTFLSLTRVSNYNQPQGENRVRIFTCNVCTNQIFFAPGYPEEAAEKGWIPWKVS